jgi:hypothetical protein
MIDIFSSNDDNLNFQKNGYIVKDVSEKLIDDLILVYKKVKPFFFFETMYFNLLNQNERNVIADREIRLIFSDFIKETFRDYSDDLACFVTKRFKNKWDLGWHQDWTMTDEHIAPALLCWIPLQDTDETNGGLTVLGGTHNFFSNSIRSYYMPSIYISVYEKLFNEFQTKLSLKKGQILIFSHSLFHGSFINNSWQNRVSAMISVFPKITPKIYYYKDDSGVYKMEITRDFHFNHQPYLNKCDLRKFYNTVREYSADELRFVNKEDVYKMLSER